ncbi:MAG TPA: efflux RND transporter periplasmic adaptor subunit [Thermoanaerobaculia bacterium]|nr:efflux RND transporter periplasmic adaptor subunit [Thermoanaerobaculia bacterium]
MAQEKRSRKKLFITIGIAIVVLITLGSMVVAKKREKATSVTTDKAFRKTITQLVTATGKIQPEVEVPIAPEVSGEIIEIPVREGQQVHKGDLLLKIKPDAYQAQVEAQQAALSAARSGIVQHRAELAKADIDYKRAMNLFNQKLLSEADRNAAQTNYDIARAALQSSSFEAERAEGALRQIRDALSKTSIFAPADGTISTLPARVGQRVVGTSQFAGTEVMKVANLNAMEAVVNVNENDVVNVKAGDSARISVDAYPDRIIRGIVREIASTASTKNAGTQEEVTNFEVKISIPDRTVVLRPGMSATADIETATVQNAVVVPIQSVTVRTADSKLSPEEAEKENAAAKARDSGDNRADVTNTAVEKRKQREMREKLQRVVFVRTGDKVKMQRVETGLADNTYIEIKSGIKPGDEVVSGSYTVISRKLKDGSKVQIEKPGAKAS